MSFLNAKVNAEHVTESLPPFVQWFRGTLKPKDPAPIKKGCWELQASQWEHIVDDEKRKYNFEHGNNEVPGYAFSELSFAVLAWRIDYQIVDRNGQLTYLDPKDYQEGATMKLRVYVYIKEVSEFAILTLSRGNGYAMRDAITKDYKTKVIAPATTLSGGKSFPLYAFWLIVGAGPKKVYPQGSHATPPKMVNPTGKPENYLEDLYVGDDILELCSNRYEKATEWADQKFGTSTTEQVTSDMNPTDIIPHTEQGLDDVALEDVFNTEN